MEWGIALNLRESVQETLEKAILADRGGLEEIWITDYPATRLSPILASAVARHTEHCRIGIGLLSPLIFSPSQIIQYLSSLIDLYGERFDLLLGPGDRIKLRQIGSDYGDIPTLVERIVNSMNFIKNGLSKYKDFGIFVGAQGEKMIRGAVGAQGILLNYSDPDMIQWASSLLKKRPKGFKVGIFPPSLVGSSKSCNEHMGIKTSAAVVALGLNPSIMRRFELNEELQPIRKRMREQGLTDDIVDMIDFKTLMRFCLCGNFEQVFDRLGIYQELGVEKIVFGPPQGASLSGVKRLINTRQRFYSSI